LSVRYISGRFLPDKAIDVVDEASSRVRIASSGNAGELKRLETDLARARQEETEADSAQDWERAAKAKQHAAQLQQQIADERARLGGASLRLADSGTAASAVDGSQAGAPAPLGAPAAPGTPEVTVADIAAVVSRWSGVPAEQLKAEEAQRYLDLERVL